MFSSFVYAVTAIIGICKSFLLVNSYDSFILFMVSSSSLLMDFFSFIYLWQIAKIYLVAS